MERDFGPKYGENGEEVHCMESRRLFGNITWGERLPLKNTTRDTIWREFGNITRGRTPVKNTTAL